MSSLSISAIQGPENPDLSTDFQKYSHALELLEQVNIEKENQLALLKERYYQQKREIDFRTKALEKQTPLG